MKKLLVIISTLTLCTAALAFAKGPEAITDLKAALEKAKKEHKLLFVRLGRNEGVGSRTLQTMTREGDLKLLLKDFVYADLNCDDRGAAQLFHSKFKVEGHRLPFVVIADADGQQLAAAST